MKRRNILVAATMAVLVMMTGTLSAHAAPGDVLFSDNFDDGSNCSALAPWTTTNTDFSGTSTQTSNSGNCSLFTAGGFVQSTSPVTDLSTVTGADFTAWVRRGSDTFSEDTDTNEDFEIQYLNSTGTWITLETYLGSGTKGQIINVSRSLPIDALHSGFRIRVEQTAGSNLPYDFWHIDDVTITETGTPPPPTGTGDIGVNRCEGFESGFGNWTTTNSTRSGISGQTSNSGSNSLFTRHDPVTTTSVSFNSAGLNQLTVWVRRGADSFSENPEGNENLRIEYLNASNSWVTLETFSGSGTQGQIFDRTYNLPASAQHANFQVRFTQTEGSGSNFDYWHIDDVCFLGEGPDFSVNKSVRIEQDPINGTTNALGIPGSWAVYTITVTNNGIGTADPGSINLRDIIDEKTSLFTGDFDGSGSPFDFIDGTGVNESGVSLNWGGVSDNTDGVTFFNASGNPVFPNGDFDPAAAEFLLQFTGTMNGTGGGGNPSFSIEYRVLVE